MSPLKITTVHTSLSSGKLSDILRISRLGYWEYGLISQELFLAREAFQILHLDQNSTGLDSQDISSMVHPHDLEEIEETIKASLRNKSDFRAELRIIRPGVPIQFLCVEGEVVCGTDSRPVRIIGTLADISQKRAMEDRLRHFEEMVNANTNTMAFVDCNYNFLAVNSAFLDVFGVTLEQTIGHSAAELMGEDHFNHIARPALDRCLAGDQLNIQRTHTLPNGVSREVDMNYIPYRQEDGTVAGVVICAHDITSLKQAQRSLVESEKMLHEAQRIAKMGYWKRNLSNDVVFLSDEIFRINGIKPEQFSGEWAELINLIHREDREFVLANTAAAIDECRNYKIEYRIVQPDGNVRFVQVQGELELSDIGSPTHVFGTLMDITEQKLVEEKLRRYEHIINTTTDFMAYIDRNYVYQSVNQGYLDTFGKSWEQVVGHTMAEILGAEYFQNLVKPMIDSCLAGKAVNTERWLPDDPDGGRCMDIRYTPFHDRDGRITGVVINIRDITDKKSAQDMLLRYEQIVHASSDVMALIDNEQKYLAVNRRFLETINRSRAEVIGHSLAEVLDRDYYDSFVSPNIMRCLRGETVNFQCWCEFHPLGQRFADVTYTPWRQADGGIAGAVIDVHDITRLKLAQKSLERSEQQLQEAQRIAQLGFWEWDLVADTLYRSRVGDQIMGLDLSTMDRKIASQRDDNRFHPDDLERIKNAINQALAGKQRYDIKHRILRWPDNEVRHVHVQAEVLRESDGRPVKMFGTMQDITQLKCVEEELAKHRVHLEELVRQRTAELEKAQRELIRKERLATLGQLTATVSHELRNPLGASVFSLHTLKRYIKDDNVLVKDMLERLERNIMRCDHIIDELLDFTRVGNFTLTHKCLDSWLVEVLSEQIIPDNLEVQMDLSLGDLILQYDPDHLRRAVINIFENASHSMVKADDPGELRVGARITISSRLFKDRIEVTIKDQGPGIPDDVLPNIFEPLFSTKNFGVGLGLPTVKRIMEQHDGGIEIETVPDRGTSVTLWLPVSLVVKKVAA